MQQADFTLKCAMTEENGYYRFTFLCELCAGGYTTGLISAASLPEACACARREARQHFNRCQSCLKWVCDEHYNEDVMMCTACAPRRG